MIWNPLHRARSIDLEHIVHSIGTAFNNFFSFGALDLLSDTPLSDAEKLLTDVEALMVSTSYVAKFSPAVEDTYKQSLAKPRAKLFTRIAVVGTIIYNLFLVIDWIIIPDAILMAALLQLLIVTPIIFISIIAIARHDIDSGIPALLCFLMIMAATILIISFSRSPHINLATCVFSLFIIAACVTGGMELKLAVLYCIIGAISVPVMILLHPSLSTTDRIFLISFLYISIAYSLNGSYRIEAGTRTVYLYALRESLRARLLEVSNRKLKTLVDIDGLTGVGNRRYLDESLSDEWRALAMARPVVILLIDIDHFKKFNDDYGHQTGDECLRSVAQALAVETSSAAMKLARYGGEEFAVVIADMPLADAAVFAETLRRGVESLSFKTETGAALSVTISIGCAAAVPSAFNTPADLVRAADAALYQAKRSGRNRVEIAELKALGSTFGQQAGTVTTAG